MSEQSSQNDRPGHSKMPYVLATAFLAVLLLGYNCWVDCRVPASGFTGVNMKNTALCINRYVSAQGAYPEQLRDMIPLSDQDESMLLDGWGRELGYRRNADGTITLYSYGRDGVLGGQGKDSDMFRTYEGTSWYPGPVK